MTKPTLTLVAVFYKEAHRLDGYFANLKGVADEYIVVDCRSPDGTADLCRRHGAQVVESGERYFEQNVNKALRLVKTDWVLILDADERLTPQLKAGIRRAMEDTGKDVFLIHRLNYIYDGFSRKGTINTWLPRLFRPGHVRWEKEMPHEVPKVEGRVGRLEGKMLHYAFVDITAFVKKMEDYLCQMPAEYHKKGQTQVRIGERDSASIVFGTHGWRRLVLYPPVLFLSHLLGRRMILDGVRGVLFSANAAIYAFLEESIHYDLRSKERRGIAIDWSREYPDRAQWREEL